MGDFIKSLFGSLDKVTDILNIGRLVFYTAAGLPPVTTLAMIIRTVGFTDRPYWNQFRDDFVLCIQNPWVWGGGVIAGFVVANMAYVRAICSLSAKPSDLRVNQAGFAYQYPRLRTGRVRRGPSEEDFDFAAWLLSEYYRYVEIAVYVPYGVLLSLPLLTIYSFARVLLDAQYPDRLDAGFFGFGLWAAATTLGWTAGWRRYWLPKVATPIFRTYVSASAALFQGVNDYAKDTAVESAPHPAPKKKESEKP